MASEQHGSTFLCLPREVRDKIYTNYLDALRAPLTEASYRYWSESKNPELAFLAKPYAHSLPALLETCKTVYRELAPEVLRSASMRVGEPKFSTRIGIGVFGRFDLSKVRKLYLIIDASEPLWMQWVEFFQVITSFDTREWEFKRLFENYSDETVPAATELEELVVVWGPSFPIPITIEEEEAEAPVDNGREATVRAQVAERAGYNAWGEEKFLRHVAALPNLKIVRLCNNYPERWGPWLTENTGTVVFCE